MTSIKENYYIFQVFIFVLNKSKGDRKFSLTHNADSANSNSEEMALNDHWCIYMDSQPNQVGASILDPDTPKHEISPSNTRRPHYNSRNTSDQNQGDLERCATDIPACLAPSLVVNLSHLQSSQQRVCIQEIYGMSNETLISLSPKPM